MTNFIFISFWILLYYLDGSRDGYFDRQLKLRPPASNFSKDNYFRSMWHCCGTISFAMIHLSLSALVSALNQFSWLSAFSFLVLSLGIRIFFRDLFYDITVGRSIFSVPSCQSKLDFWDCILSYLDDKLHLTPILVRFLIFVLTIIFFGFIQIREIIL